MALTHAGHTLPMAQEAAKIADDTKKLLVRIKQFLDTNSDLAIDWAAGASPAYINEDANGNVDGTNFTRQQVANIVNSFDQIRKTLENEAVSQGDHLGNVNLIASANPSFPS